MEKDRIRELLTTLDDYNAKSPDDVLQELKPLYNNYIEADIMRLLNVTRSYACLLYKGKRKPTFENYLKLKYKMLLEGLQ